MSADLASLFECLVAVFMRCASLSLGLVFVCLAIVLTTQSYSEQHTRDATMLRSSLHALQSFLLLGGRAFLASQAAAVVACLDKSVALVRDSSAFVAMDVLDTALRLGPEMAPLLNASLARVASDAIAPEVRSFLAQEMQGY
jgi:hypothetical protein